MKAQAQALSKLIGGVGRLCLFIYIYIYILFRFVSFRFVSFCFVLFPFWLFSADVRFHVHFRLGVLLAVRFSNASSRPPSSAGSSYRRPSSVASSRASTARGSRPNSSSSSRSTLNPGNPQVKAKAYVDETLFGAPSVLSAEELHKQMWAGSKPFWKATEVVDTGPKRPKARKSTRCDFDAPVELPSGPAGDGRRFAKTSTLNGGYDAPRHARPAANKPSSIGRSLIAHKPQRQSRQPSGSSKPIRSPFIHSNNKFEATAKPAARMNNTIWANMPNT